MTQTVAVIFHRSSAPYEAGDVAGFTVAHAMALVGRGIAGYWPPLAVKAAAVEAPIDFAGMSRDELIAYGQDHFGFAGEVPDDVTDDALREALADETLAAAQASAPVPAAAADKTVKPGKAKP